MAANHVCILTNQALGTQEARLLLSWTSNPGQCVPLQDTRIPPRWVKMSVASCCFIFLLSIVKCMEMYGDVWRCIECITAETWMPVSPAAQSKGEELTVKSPLVSLCPTLLALATKKPRDSMDMFNIQPNSTEINKYLDQKSWEVWPWHSPSRFYVAEQVTWIHTTIQYTKSSLRTPNLRCHHSFDIVCIQGSNNLSKKKNRLAALFQSPSSLYHP